MTRHLFGLLIVAGASQAGASLPTPPAGFPLTIQNFSQATAVAIPSGGIAESTLLANPPVGATLWDVDVSTSINHAHPGDLTIVLISPAGTISTLSHGNGADASFNGTVWDDQASPGGLLPYVVASGTVARHPYQTGVLASPLAPEEPLGAFRWQDPSGSWKVRIHNAGSTAGTLQGWSISMGTVPTRPASRVVRYKSLTGGPVPDGGTLDLPIVVSSRCNYVLGVVGARVRLDTARPDQFGLQLIGPTGNATTLAYRVGAAVGPSFSDSWFRETGNAGGDVPYTTLAGLARSHPYDGNPVPLLVPEEPLSNLIGGVPNGTWKVRISDLLSTFLAATPAGVAEVDLELTGCTDLEDWNSDAQGDILFRNTTTGENQIWEMEGKDQVGLVSLPTFAASSELVCTGDFGTSSVNPAPDGHPDVLFRDKITSELRVWMMNGVIVNETATPTPSGPVNANWKIGGCADADRDGGDTDILWNNRDSGKAVYWWMNGLVKTSGWFLQPDFLPPGLWDQVAVSDMGWSITEPELDGVPDIVWRNNTSGRVVVWYMGGLDGSIKQSGSFVTPMDAGGPDWVLRAVNDLGSSAADPRPDGWQDLIWQQTSTGQVLVWFMKGGNRLSQAFTTPATNPGFTVVGPR